MNQAAAELPMRQGYHPDTGVGVDPAGNLIGTITPNICAEIDARNGWFEPKEIAERPRNQRFEDAAEMLGELLRWLATSDSIHSMGLRAWAVVIAVRPDLVPCKANQSELARGLGVRKQAVSKYVGQLFKLANGQFVHGNACVTAPRREAARSRALEYHQKLRKDFGPMGTCIPGSHKKFKSEMPQDVPPHVPHPSRLANVPHALSSAQGHGRRQAARGGPGVRC